MVLKELIFNSFYFGQVWCCGGLARTDFSQFLCWEGWWSCKGLTVGGWWS